MTHERWVYPSLALYSLQQNDKVRIFLSGKGVDIDKIGDPKFDVKDQSPAEPA